MRIDCISTGLDVGGAELNLMRLVAGLKQRGHQVRVASLTGRGVIGYQMQKKDIDTYALGVTSATIVPGLMKLSRWLRQGKADVIQTWMYHANVLGALANRFAHGTPMIWGIRQSNLHRVHSKRSTRLITMAGRRKFKRVKSIVCCAESVRKVHESLGYDARKMVVIPNGIDVAEFRPIEGARRRLLEQLSIEDSSATLVGLVGRFDAQKDHRNFLRAARIFAENVTNTHLVLCGSGVDWNNGQLKQWIESYFGSRGVHLLGVRMDVANVISGLDLLVSSASYGEGFPNVVAEAMACKVPVIGTDVGETAAIIGEQGWLVEREDPEALASAMLSASAMSKEERSELVVRARARIEENYSVDEMCSRYEALYQTILGQHSKCAA